MRLKSFHGKTAADAMQKIKQTLGDEAVIISTEKENDGSVYVIAAIEPAIAPKKVVITQTPHFIERLEEILIKHHTPFNTISDLLNPKKIKPQAKLFSSFESILSETFQFEPLNFKNIKTPKRYIFIGPPGVGKTLSIAKYASQLHIDRISSALVTTDIIRSGGIEQLSNFAKLLNIPLTSVEDPYALIAAQKFYHDKKVILIDTQGVNPFNETEKNELLKLLDQTKNTEIILTLPAAGNPIDSEDYLNSFSEIPISKILFTKLDLTKRLGNMIHITYKAKLPLMGYSNTANVARDIAPLTPSSYAKLILPKNYHPASHQASPQKTQPKPFIPEKKMHLKAIDQKIKTHPSKALNLKGFAI